MDEGGDDHRRSRDDHNPVKVAEGISSILGTLSKKSFKATCVVISLALCIVYQYTIIHISKIKFNVVARYGTQCRTWCMQAKYTQNGVIIMDFCIVP